MGPQREGQLLMKTKIPAHYSDKSVSHCLFLLTFSSFPLVQGVPLMLYQGAHSISCFIPVILSEYKGTNCSLTFNKPTVRANNLVIELHKLIVTLTDMKTHFTLICKMHIHACKLNAMVFFSGE